MKGSWVAVLLLALMAGEAASVTTFYSMFKGEAVSPRGDYVVYRVTWIRCVAICIRLESCIVWSWDSANWRCQIYSYVAPLSYPNPDTATTKTYSLVTGFFFVNTVRGNPMTWQEGADLCAANNGIVAFVGHEEIKLLLQTIQWYNTWFGLTRATAMSPWVDHLGNQPANLYWATGEPAANNLKTYYQFGGDGLFTIWPTYSSDFPTLCAYV